MSETTRVEYTMAMQNLRDAVDRMNSAAALHKPREYWNVTAFEYEVDDSPLARLDPLGEWDDE